MTKYKTFKTTMGRKYKVRMSKDEIAEQELYRLVLVTLPFVGSILLTVVWLARG